MRDLPHFSCATSPTHLFWHLVALVDFLSSDNGDLGAVDVAQHVGLSHAAFWSSPLRPKRGRRAWREATQVGRSESMSVVTTGRRTSWILGVGRFLRSIRSELVSGASDNDPTDEGTAVAVGAQTVWYPGRLG